MTSGTLGYVLLTVPAPLGHRSWQHHALDVEGRIKLLLNSPGRYKQSMATAAQRLQLSCYATITTRSLLSGYGCFRHIDTRISW